MTFLHASSSLWLATIALFSSKCQASVSFLVLFVLYTLTFPLEHRALDGHFWWAVGIVAPHIGAIIGSLLYLLMSKMRMSYVDSSHQLDSVLPPLNPDRDIIYQKGMEMVVSERNGSSANGRQ